MLRNLQLDQWMHLDWKQQKLIFCDLFFVGSFGSLAKTESFTACLVKWLKSASEADYDYMIMIQHPISN